jgi:hypothetical protein
MQTNTVTQEIRDAHKRILGLIRQLEAVSARAPEMREPVIRQLTMECEILTKLEEEILQPAIQGVGDAQLSGAVTQSLDEHRKAHSLLQNLKATPRRGDGTGQTDLLGKVSSEFELLIRQDEEGLLPLTERGLQDRLFELGTWFKTRREELLASSRYADAQPQLTQNPNGGEQMRTKGVA